jgi:hypothetical protein
LKKWPTFWGYLFPAQGYAFILTKMVWATFWAIFSQTNRVTLTTTFQFDQSDLLLPSAEYYVLGLGHPIMQTYYNLGSIS